MIDRRSFMLLSAAALGGCAKLGFVETTPSVHMPGMQDGHLLRDRSALPEATEEISTQVLILGSGIAGLSAAWKLSREGFTDFLLLDGPEFGGNASGGAFAGLRYPRGAHYLPLQSLESTHMRDMLSDFGVIERDRLSDKPYYDERALVHAPDERLYVDGTWHDGLVPNHDLSTEDAEQHRRFFQYVDTMKQQRGSDGRRVFCIPLALSSADPQWTVLDQLTFSEWMKQNGYHCATLRWYLNYVCRDEYGAESDQVSAWAGLHYFASRAGQAQNAADGAVMTWPDGLNEMVKRMTSAIATRHPAYRRNGFAVRVSERPSAVETLCAQKTANGIRTFNIKSKRVICAMPLQVAKHIVTDLKHTGFDPATDMPSVASWMISNFLMSGFPSENDGVPLAWDNVVYQGKGLGYVVSTHQEIRVAAPAKTVFSAYHALSRTSPTAARQWLTRATPQELFEEAASDLRQVYGRRLNILTEAVEITVRGHAMATPRCGSLTNKGIASLRAADGKLLFAHSDLSGLSVFEEAAWWGCEAAKKILA